MNSHRLSTSVIVVPRSATQRTSSSCPRGINNSASANNVGTKITSDIKIRSYSAFANMSAFPASRTQSAAEIEHQNEQGHRRQDHEQHVIPQIPRLDRAQPAPHPINHPGREVHEAVNNSQIKAAA